MHKDIFLHSRASFCEKIFTINQPFFSGEPLASIKIYEEPQKYNSIFEGNFLALKNISLSFKGENYLLSVLFENVSVIFLKLI